TEMAYLIFAETERLPSVTTKSWLSLKAFTEGLRHFSAGKISRAIQSYEDAVKYDPGFAWAWAELGNVYLIRMPDAALEALLRALTLDPRHTRAYQRLAWAHVVLFGRDRDPDQLREAVEAQRQALRLRKKLAWFHHDLAIHLLRQA